MTHAEIIQKVKDTFKVGDRVFMRSWNTKGGWCEIHEIDYEYGIIGCTPEKREDYSSQLTFIEALAILSFTEYTLEPIGFSQERPKPKKKNGDPFEVGDEVWISMGFGVRAGKVINVRASEGGMWGTWEILVEIQGVEGVGSKFSFSMEGRYVSSGDIVLFHQKPVITFED